MTQKRTLYGAAAHLSSLSTLFPLMQLAMMMTGATPSCLLERSIFFFAGFVPLSSLIRSMCPSTLPREEACSGCQQALTEKRTLKRRFEVEAYSR